MAPLAWYAYCQIQVTQTAHNLITGISLHRYRKGPRCVGGFFRLCRCLVVGAIKHDIMKNHYLWAIKPHYARKYLTRR